MYVVSGFVATKEQRRNGRVEGKNEWEKGEQ